MIFIKTLIEAFITHSSETWILTKKDLLQISIWARKETEKNFWINKEWRNMEKKANKVLTNLYRCRDNSSPPVYSRKQFVTMTFGIL
mgnify:CR=1 FL=1